MILVDTSVWVDHLRRGNPRLAELLDGGKVVSHPFVIGELGCGTLRQRRTILAWLAELPVAASATHAEVMAFIEARRLMGRGLGYVDVHLLAAASIEGCSLWTLDQRLHLVADALGVAPAPGSITS